MWGGNSSGSVLGEDLLELTLLRSHELISSLVCVSFPPSGGGVMGSPGRNAARAVANDFKSGKYGKVVGK